ncbi:hypothetical protein HanRHA438_Chr02g0090701 [Helianthus annuus]|nr:hypothetical protein HanIR_Chr02g0092541 [Helianthus annuus]KAJ0941093.1 hypothetical protein HanRHA438_Chr02g0090701 [Helianthus annuus]
MWRPSPTGPRPSATGCGFLKREKLGIFDIGTILIGPNAFNSWVTLKIEF